MNKDIRQLNVDISEELYFKTKEAAFKKKMNLKTWVTLALLEKLNERVVKACDSCKKHMQTMQ